MTMPSVQPDVGPTPLPASFTALYRAHYAFVWRCARQLGASEADLDDAVQETFVIALRRISTYDGGSGHQPAWLFGILRNVLRNQSRGRRRHTRKVRAVAIERKHQGAMLGPRRGAMEELGRSLLDDFVHSLDEDHRVVYVLAELEGHNSSEIGEALGISPNTARSRLRAARAAFDRHFDEGHRAAVLSAARCRPKASRTRQRATLQAIAAAELGHVGLAASSTGLASSGVGAVWAKLGLAVVLIAGTTTLVLVSTTRDAAEELAALSPSLSASQPERASGAEGASAPTIDVDARDVPDTAASVLVRPATQAPSDPSPPARARVPAADDDAHTHALAVLARARTALIEQRPQDGLAALAAVSSWPDINLARRALATRTNALCALGRSDEAEAAVAAWSGPALPDEFSHVCW